MPAGKRTRLGAAGSPAGEGQAAASGGQAGSSARQGADNQSMGALNAARAPPSLSSTLPLTPPHLVQADLSVGDLEDGVSVRLVLLDALVGLLTLLGQLHSGHRHGGRVVAGTVSGGEGEDKEGPVGGSLLEPGGLRGEGGGDLTRDSGTIPGDRTTE